MYSGILIEDCLDKEHLSQTFLNLKRSPSYIASNFLVSKGPALYLKKKKNDKQTNCLVPKCLFVQRFHCKPSSEYEEMGHNVIMLTRDLVYLQ